MDYEAHTSAFQTLSRRFNSVSVRHIYMIRRNAMPMYETRVRTAKGEETKQVYAKDAQEAKKLFEQMYGGPRKVPYIPHLIPS